MKFAKRVYRALRAAFDWFAVAAHRRSLYRAAQIAAPVLVTLGWVTDAQASRILTSVSGALLLAYGNLAEKNAPDSLDQAS